MMFCFLKSLKLYVSKFVFLCSFTGFGIWGVRLNMVSCLCQKCDKKNLLISADLELLHSVLLLGCVGNVGMCSDLSYHSRSALKARGQKIITMGQ